MGREGGGTSGTREATVPSKGCTSTTATYSLIILQRDTKARGGGGWGWSGWRVEGRGKVN